MPTFTEDDVGKQVVDAQGNEIGQITGVEKGVAYIDPFPCFVDQVKSLFGWDDIEQGDYQLEPDDVTAVTDREVRLDRRV